jgi:hypothetical protein
MMEEKWKYLHKPRYVDLDQLNGDGTSATNALEAIKEAIRDEEEIKQKRNLVKRREFNALVGGATGTGPTLGRVAAEKGHPDLVEPLQGLGIDAGVDYGNVLSVANGDDDDGDGL